MPVILSADNRTAILYLNPFYPPSLHKDGCFSEYSLFKYCRDRGKSKIIITYFARNVRTDKPQTPTEWSDSVTTIKQEIVLVIKAFPLYHP